MSLGEKLSMKDLLHFLEMPSALMFSAIQYPGLVETLRDVQPLPMSLDSTVFRHLELQFLMGVVASLILSHGLLCFQNNVIQRVTGKKRHYENGIII